MNEHFLLKLPLKLHNQVEEEIANNIYHNYEIFTNNNKIIFKYKDKEYNTIQYNLPCIIELQKTMDNKQFFKVDDVSSCLFIIDDELTNEKIKDDLEKEFELLESHVVSSKSKILLEQSGISPSLFLAKIRRFRKKSQKALEAHFKDQKVKELLEKEKLATDIQIIYGEEESRSEEDIEEDISSFAAEIEMSLREEVIDQNIKGHSDILRELEEKIRFKEEQLQNASNVILKKRFQENLYLLKIEYEKAVKEIERIENEKQ